MLFVKSILIVFFLFSGRGVGNGIQTLSTVSASDYDESLFCPATQDPGLSCAILHTLETGESGVMHSSRLSSHVLGLHHRHSGQSLTARPLPKPSARGQGPFPRCAADSCPLSVDSPNSCPLTPGLGKDARRRGAPVSATKMVVVDSPSRWWEKQAILWTVIHKEADFKSAIMQSTDQDIVVVDWFATWCHSCEAVYPELCRLASDPALSRVKFVKACIDGLRSLAREQGAKALPYITVYRKGEKLVGMQLPPSKAKNLRTNLETILGVDDPSKEFTLDPNGFVKAVTRTMTDDQKARAKAEALAEMRKMQEQTRALSSRLMQVADAATSSGGAASSAVPAPVATGHGAASQAGATEAAKQAVSPAKAAFLAEYGEDYGYGGKIDQLYPVEVGNRMGPDQHYLDYTGSSLYCNSQLEAAFQELRAAVFGNPHSANPSSELTSERVDTVRDIILRFFNADPMEYNVVFTPSATGSLKLVGETFPWTPESEFRYLRENHNSVLGVREYTVKSGGTYRAVSELQVESWLAQPPKPEEEDRRSGSKDEMTYSLFSFPGEDNFAGVKYPLSWITRTQAKSTPHHRWMVMLDAAAYVPTQPLDLRKERPEYVALSFYKMFGYPTGLGALIVRSDAVDMLHKVFWGGGTVSLATSVDDFHVLKCRPYERLEDGTVAFLDIIQLKHGFNMMEKVGGITAIQRHVAVLTHYLYLKLTSLRHSNGGPLLKVFGKHDEPNWRQVQGGIVNFELLTPSGGIYSYRTFQLESAAAGFHVRTGAECNPGACYNYIGIEEEEVEELAGTKEGCSDDVEWITVKRPKQDPNPFHPTALTEIAQATKLEVAPAPSMEWIRKPLGTIRVSLGYMSRFEDAEALVNFVRTKYTDRLVEEMA